MSFIINKIRLKFIKLIFAAPPSSLPAFPAAAPPRAADRARPPIPTEHRKTLNPKP